MNDNEEVRQDELPSFVGAGFTLSFGVEGTVKKNIL